MTFLMIFSNKILILSLPAVQAMLRSFTLPVTTATVSRTCHLLSSMLSCGLPDPISQSVSSSNSTQQQTFLPSDLLFMASAKLNKSTIFFLLTYHISLFVSLFHSPLNSPVSLSHPQKLICDEKHKLSYLIKWHHFV